MIKNNLIKKQKKLTKQLFGLGPFIEGSLTTTYRMCQSTGCACQRGQKHPSMFFTWKENKVTKSLYVPVEKQKQALECQKNYKKLKEIIRSLSDLQKEILKSS